jgi:phosphoribosylamine---glycine ligase
MRVLVVGSGGREHALCWAIAASPLVREAVLRPRQSRNRGARRMRGRWVRTTLSESSPWPSARSHRFRRRRVPKRRLVAGLVDRLAEAGIPAFGPSAAAARLEGSKGFMKDFCAQATAFPPPPIRRFTDAEAGAPICARKARPSSSRPTASPPARAWSSPRPLRRPLAAIATSWIGGKFGGRRRAW